jgi:hypothetical protein
MRIVMETTYWFEAKYSGHCRNCSKTINIGDMIGYIEDELVGQQCCAGQDITTSSIMPTGKTTKDRCNSCYMIHSNGQVGCE